METEAETEAGAGAEAGAILVPPKSKKRRANQAEGPSWEDSLSLSGTYFTSR